jgi:RNA polymerase sigma-70 factor, ECF subfamily
MNGQGDRQLLHRYRRGSQEAFEELVRLRGPEIKAYALRMLRNPERAEEVFVETFSRLAQQAKRWQDRGTVRSFLFTVTQRQCLDILRRGQTRRAANTQLIDLERARSLVPNAEASAILGELADELERAIAMLSPEHRQILLLRAVHGHSGKETAEIVGLEPSQVHSLYSYARKLLRQNLADSELATRTNRQAGRTR